MAYPFLKMESIVKPGYNYKKQTKVCNAARLSRCNPTTLRSYHAAPLPTIIPKEGQPQRGQTIGAVRASPPAEGFQANMERKGVKGKGLPHAEGFQRSAPVTPRQ